MKRPSFRLIIALGLLLVFVVKLAFAHTGGQIAGLDPKLFFFYVFLFGFGLGIITQIAGTGGGVIFTTIMLGFTRIHPDIVRATGLLVALSATKISARKFLRKGLANIRIVLLIGVTYTLCAIIGAVVGLCITKYLGLFGTALIKLLMGIIVILVGTIYLVMKSVEYPSITKPTPISKKLGLCFPYWEESLNKVVDYQVVRIRLGILLFCIVGFISGMFGLGAGWAVTPVLNLIMLTPLKVATATSVTLISLGDTAAIFPYFMSHSIIPILAVPAVSGSMTGAEIGARIAVKAKPKLIRYILIAILFFTGIKLIITSLKLMGVI